MISPPCDQRLVVNNTSAQTLNTRRKQGETTKTPPQKKIHTQNTTKTTPQKKHHHKNTKTKKITTQKQNNKKTPQQKNNTKTTTHKNNNTKKHNHKNTAKKKYNQKNTRSKAASKIQRRSRQNDRFVRGFRKIFNKKFPKRSFRTRLPPNVIIQASKTSVSCDASDDFH